MSKHGVFAGLAKCGGTKPHKGVPVPSARRLWFCVARAAVRRRSVYRVLRVQEKYFGANFSLFFTQKSLKNAKNSVNLKRIFMQIYFSDNLVEGAGKVIYC
jgi:hypothetical protein